MKNQNNIFSKKIGFTLFASLVMLSFINPFRNNEQISTTKSNDNQISTKQHIAKDELEVDTEKSEVSWIGTKPTGRHNGIFKIKTGKIRIDGNKIIGGKIEIDVKSLEVKDLEKGKGKEGLERHLLSKDFFEVEQYPIIEFQIAELKAYKAPANKEKTDPEFTISDPTHYITGNLTLKGVAKSITFPAKVDIKRKKVEAVAKFNIDRTDWGLNYGSDKSLGNKFIRPEVHIGFSFVAGK